MARGLCSSPAAPISTSPALHAAYLARSFGGLEVKLQHRRDARFGGVRPADAGELSWRTARRFAHRSSSMRRAPGPMTSPRRAASGRSASRPSAGRWSSCGSAARACSDLPLVDDARRQLLFQGRRRSIASGSARMTRSPAIPATPRPRRSTSRPRSTASRTVVDWPVERVERSWAGLRSFAPDRLPVYGFDADAPGSSGAPGRAASASRPRRRPRSWPRRCCSARTRRLDGRGNRPRSLLARALRAEPKELGRRGSRLPSPTIQQGNERVGDGRLFNAREPSIKSEL